MRLFKYLLLIFAVALVPSCSGKKSDTAKEGSDADDGRFVAQNHSDDRNVATTSHLEEDDSIPEGALSASGRIDRKGELSDPNNVPSMIYFEFDKSEVKGDEKEVVRRNRVKMEKMGSKARSNLVVEVHGHCDIRGTREYNLMLGERRARSAIAALRAAGSLGGIGMISKTYGKDKPIALGTTEHDHALNRRAHIIYTDKKDN